MSVWQMSGVQRSLRRPHKNAGGNMSQTRYRHEVYIAVVHVAVWCGDGLDDGVCAGFSVRLFFIIRGVTVVIEPA